MCPQRGQGIVENVCVFHDAVISTKLFLDKLLLLHHLKKEKEYVKAFTQKVFRSAS